MNDCLTSSMCYTQALYYNYAAACFVGVSELNKKNKRAKTFKNGEIKIKKYIY